MTAEKIDLVPRLDDQGYEADQVERRRAWLEDKVGCELPHVGACSIPTAGMRGNVENPVGAAQVPLGIAGPLRVRGEHADGDFYVPLATTEGALVRSYERGMVALTRAGGAVARVHVDENRVAPIFCFDDVDRAARFAAFLEESFPEIRAAAEAGTEHGELLRLEPRPVGRDVIVDFCYRTGDAQGMNMISAATDRACRWIAERTDATGWSIFSGHGSEKRAGGRAMCGGKGKTVTAGARLPGSLTRTYLNSTPAGIVETWRRTVLGHLRADAVGYNGHYANGLAAIFIACGQDVANVANSSVGITGLELVGDGDLYASVTLPSLSVATVGGGTGQGTARECLRILGCAGGGKARKLAEIVASTLLAGELSMGAAIAAGDLVDAHERLGRNRPGRADEAPR